MTRYNTLLLDRTAWDLVLDSAGDIAMAMPPYSLAQDVASAIRLFKGELWYNQDKGVPYFEQVLGQLPPRSLIAGLIEKAALTVPGVTKAHCVIANFSNRKLTGQVRFIDELGNQNAVNF